MIDDRNGDSTVFGGAYVEIREPERLAFTWGRPDDPIGEATVVTVTLTADGEGTEITLHVRGIRGGPGEGRAYDGWDQALDALVDRLGDRTTRDGPRPQRAVSQPAGCGAVTRIGPGYASRLTFTTSVRKEPLDPC